MPANLPPQYFDAEKRYREGKSPEAKVAALEEMLAIMPKHKGTDKLRADLRRRLSKHRDRSLKKKGTAKYRTAYAIEKEGAAQAVVIGAPNAGKSSLLAALTKAAPRVAEYPHTTHKPMPGMAPFQDIQFQLVDTPPLTREYVDPLMADLLRRADILVVMIDLAGDTLQQYRDILAILEEFRIFPEGYPVPEALAKQPFIKKILVAVNKMDEGKDEEAYGTFLELTGLALPCLGMSLKTGKNLALFLPKIYESAGVIRVYTRSPGKEPDLKEPYVIPRESTLETLACRIHGDFAEKLRYARIWGRAVKDGQMVQRDHVMQDGDIVEIHL